MSGGALVRSNFQKRTTLLAADQVALELLIWDPIRGEFVAMTFSTAVSGARVQRSVVATPIVIGPTDQILTCSINSAVACTLPLASTRNGVPLTFKEVGGFAVNYTFTPSGADTIDGGGAMIGISNAYDWITLNPFNDGTNSGWFIT